MLGFCTDQHMPPDQMRVFPLLDGMWTWPVMGISSDAAVAVMLFKLAR